MVSSINTSLSGLLASERRLANAANNLANADSSNFRATDVAQSTDASGGVTTRIVERNPATVQVADPNSPNGVSERPNVSPERELIDANLATYSFQANLRVLRAADDLNRSLLDIQA